ncbi:endonuclease V [Gemmatimonadetes bacterium T265]|nr:endonuclease V [Gemmatimonadetes bacterium T265]
MSEDAAGRADDYQFPTTIEAATAEQQRLRARVVLVPPAGFAPHLVAGLDVSMERDGDIAYAGIVVLALPRLETVAEATAVSPVRMPYVPGFLSFRELPALAAAYAVLRARGVRPDVLVFDGQGYAHPRRFGIACHGGLVFDTPSVGCAKSILVGRHGPLGEEQWARAPLVHRREVVGDAVRLRAKVLPVYISPGHLMDRDTAVQVVERVSAGFREPETTRRAHRLVNAVRRGERAPDAG